MSRPLNYTTEVTLRVGPFLDEDDGKTAETGLTINQADIRVSKNGGAFAQKNKIGGATHDENGWYYLTLDAVDTNGRGNIVLAIHVAGALPVWAEFEVWTAEVYSSFFGTDLLQTDVRKINGALTSGNNATLALKMLDIQNSAGDAVLMQSTGGAGRGCVMIGQDTGVGWAVIGGANADAASVVAGTCGNRNAIKLVSHDTGAAVFLQPGAGGFGVDIGSATVSVGVRVKGGSSGGDAMQLQAPGSGGSRALSLLSTGDLVFRAENIGGGGVSLLKSSGGADVIKLDGTGGGTCLNLLTNGAGQGIRVVAGTRAVYLSGDAGIQVVAGTAGSDNYALKLQVTKAGANAVEFNAASGASAFVLTKGTGKGIDAPEIGTLTDLGGGDSLAANLSDMAGATFSTSTDTLEHIRDAITAGGSSLTAQQVRDAMKLAPSGGVPAADSIDDHLDDLLTGQGTIIADVAALNDVSTAEVQAECEDAIDVKFNLAAGIVEARVMSKDATVPLSAQEKLDVNVEVDTALDDTIAEPVLGTPAITASMRTGIARLYSIARNAGELNSTSGEKRYFNSAGVAIAKKAVADTGTLYSETSMVGV